MRCFPVAYDCPIRHGAEAKVWPDDSCTQSAADSKDIPDRQHAAITHGRQMKANRHARADITARKCVNYPILPLVSLAGDWTPRQDHDLSLSPVSKWRVPSFFMSRQMRY